MSGYCEDFPCCGQTARAEAAEQDAFQWRSRAMLDAAERDALRRKVAAVEALHSDVHMCGVGQWWNPQGKPGASLATAGPCPTLRAVLDSDTPEATEHYGACDQW